MDELPLFPLGTVLLPGQRLPLTIFEPRYVDLLRTLMERPEPERCFGVVAIRRGHEVGVGAAHDLHELGCEARIDAIAAAVGYGEPRYQIVATGTRRFRIETLHPAGGTPWLRATVTWPPAVPAPTGQAVDRIRSELAAFARAIGAEPPELPDGAPDLASRVLGSVPTLSLDDRLAVLTAETTTEQVEIVSRLLRRERALIEGLGVVRRFEPPAPSAN